MDCKHLKTNTMITMGVRSDDGSETLLGYNRMSHCSACGRAVCTIYKDLNGLLIGKFCDLGGDGRRNAARAREMLTA